MNDIFLNTFKWIKDDWYSNRFRFCIELIAWGISIGCSITMALTVPTPPLLTLTLYGSSAVVSMLGLLLLGNLLGCWLTTCS